MDDSELSRDAQADSADEPLPGLESHGAGPGAPRAATRPERVECIDAAAQGGPLLDWLDDHASYEEWVESYRRSQMPGAIPFGAVDPLPLRGGELCDRCEEFAMIATEHVWAQHPPELAALASRDPGSDGWRSGVLLWCAKHARENQLQLLTDGAVVVGVRGA